MLRINVEEALELATAFYPQAPEKIAEYLGIKVLERDSIDAEGWCLLILDEDGKPVKAQITINTKSARPRQRFTLAHELAHIILGIPQPLGEPTSIMSPRQSDEERKVDALAAKLLLPEHILLSKINTIPVTAQMIINIAKDARVSPLAVALRIESLTKKLSIVGAMVIFYENGIYKFHRSESLRFDSNKEEAYIYLDKCMSFHPSPYRETFDEENTLVASLIDNPGFSTTTVFLQIINSEQGNKKLPEERVVELKRFLFNGNKDLERSFMGVLAHFNGKDAHKYSIEDAVKVFREVKISNYPHDPILSNKSLLLSDEATELIRLQLIKWDRTSGTKGISDAPSN